jgi:hypothetical protein
MSYLLFYRPQPGRIPDGDRAFASAASDGRRPLVANSLTWGPDGWLYGCQGHGHRAHSWNRVSTRDLALHPLT